MISSNFIKIGENLFSKDKKYYAEVLADGSLRQTKEPAGSIHKISANILNKVSNNGWDFWYVKRNNQLISINTLRENYFKEFIEKESKDV